MPSKVVQISRDPFARTTLVRRVVATTSTCNWCGGQRIGQRIGQRLFEYGTERDDRSRPDWHKGLYCSKECHDVYHS